MRTFTLEILNLNVFVFQWRYSDVHKAYELLIFCTVCPVQMVKLVEMLDASLLKLSSFASTAS